MALLGTDRRPVPDALPAEWAGPPPDPAAEPTHVVLGLAARHRAAVRAGSALPTVRRVRSRRRTIGSRVRPRPSRSWPTRCSAGRPAPVNDALAVLVDQEFLVAPEHWTALAALAAANPRVDRALLAPALGVRGVWFVGQNPQWARLAAALRNRRTGAAT